MRLFIDTEFTDFIDCDLISIALVADDGREFYGECSTFDKNACNAFVREAVLPQLGQFPARIFTRAALHAALHEWLEQFDGGTFCTDNPVDWDLLADLLGDVPPGWQAAVVWHQLDKTRLETYFREHGGRHHALHDARANQYAFV
nr:3'-5' exoribonuclease [uncultured Ralstonia sp.]